METQARYTHKTATIANTAQESDAIKLDGFNRLVAVITPSAMTGTALTLLGSVDDTTYAAVYNAAGTEVSITSAASRCIVLDSTVYGLPPYIKIKSGSAEGAERLIQLVFAGG